jgi:hypothetical protein
MDARRRPSKGCVGRVNDRLRDKALCQQFAAATLLAAGQFEIGPRTASPTSTCTRLTVVFTR